MAQPTIAPNAVAPNAVALIDAGDVRAEAIEFGTNGYDILEGDRPQLGTRGFRTVEFDR